MGPNDEADRAREPRRHASLGIRRAVRRRRGTPPGAPRSRIYPGDIIRDQMLTDADFPDATASGAYASNRSMLIGKVARRTLLPGQAIPTMAVAEPRLVTIGARVRLVYQEDGLLISTYASALQAGGVGDFVTVRNMESGITIGGTVAADGSVHVGPG